MKFSPLILILSLTPIMAFAQATGTGGGGTVLDCGTRGVQLADLQEVSAEILPTLSSLKINYSNAEVDQQVHDAFKRLGVVSPDFQAQAEKIYNGTAKVAGLNESTITWLTEEDAQWSFTNDVGLMPLPKGCVLKNAVVYYSRLIIQGNRSLYDRLSKTDKAALWVHEVIYKVARDVETLTSTRPVRRMVELLFAQTFDPKVLGDLVVQNLIDRKKINIVELSGELAEPGYRLGLDIGGLPDSLFFRIKMHGIPSADTVIDQMGDPVPYSTGQKSYIPVDFAWDIFPQGAIPGLHLVVGMVDPGSKRLVAGTVSLFNSSVGTTSCTKKMLRNSECWILAESKSADFKYIDDPRMPDAYSAIESFILLDLVDPRSKNFMDGVYQLPPITNSER